MKRLFPALFFLSFLTGASNLRAQSSRDFVFVARRSGIGEVLDAATLATVARIHFDFHVERLAASVDGSKVRVEGYASGAPCCKHYNFDPVTSKLEEDIPSRQGRDGFGECLLSPDGRWCVQLKSFRDPVLKMVDCTDPRSARELVPPNLPPQDSSGNWYSQGAWSGERFYLYVSRPDDPGLLWIVPPGVESLGAGIPVTSFNEAPGCSPRLPVVKHLVAAAGRLFLFESFGNTNKSSRQCSGLPGGAWIVDPDTGRLTAHIAPEFHFSGLIAAPSGAVVYGVGEPDQLVRWSALDGKVTNSRVLGPGEVLTIAAGRLQQPLAGDVTALASNER